ncbi:M4 family metallopeptidase [Streptomyces rubellomurinus]|uniref:Neutral metalloproteinase n=2 Tax=Streptomyces TaxID=1883 RepID=A0A0F2THU5_STRR3|nr:M4 family metallopeptidase [Streptomyces rubellomurinus]KJS56152.1 peptidase [Streptomyces rubellomurinus subsp. indigoferus]KJS62744.1 peptidase [Streptomyces rubellomurinus]
MKRKLAAVAVVSATALLTGVVQVSVSQAAPAAPSIQAQAAHQHAAVVAVANGQSAPLAKALNLGDQEKLVAKDAVIDQDGTRHLRFERTYAGLPVLGGDLVVHQKADGGVKSVDKAATAKIALPSLTPRIPADQAAAGAAGAVKATVGQTIDSDESPLVGVHQTGKAELVVWANDNNPRLAYRTTVEGVRQDGTPSSQILITDAASGAVLSTHEKIETAVGTGNGVFVGQVQLTTNQNGSQYELKDASRGGQSTSDMSNGTSGSGSLFANPNNSFGDGTAANRESAAVDAQFGAATTWDFYKNTFGRNGIRNDGVGALSRVHYGSNYVNAFWSDDCFCMSYGDGANNSAPLTEIDVAGHEMSHGVTAATAALNYSGESGGLNEATSDIMGTMVEWYANLPANPPNYQIGELINLRGDGSPLRYMDQPSKDGSSADYWDPNVGNLDVHFSSGVANHFFYLLSEGSGAKTINGFSYNSPTYDGSTLAGIGRDKAAQIWYKALTAYFTSTTDYAGARAATLSAASDLYGANSDEYNAVAAAWTAVNVN